MHSSPCKSDCDSISDYLNKSSLTMLSPIKEKNETQGQANKAKVNLSNVYAKQINPKAGSNRAYPLIADNHPVQPVKWWVKELNLKQEDRSLLVNSQGWLTDRHIESANVLLRERFPTQNGLQSPLFLANSLKFSNSNTKFVQVVNIENLHWVCISNKL